MPPSDGPRAPVAAAFADAGRRSLGLLLIALVTVPAFRLLRGADMMDGLMASSGEATWRYTWAGGAIAFAVAAAVAAVSGGRVRAALERLGDAIARPPTWAAALAVGVVGAALTAWVTFAVFEGRTVLTDASVQLMQARYFAAGHVAGPVLTAPEFWSIQFMIQTAAGWVSQYPPGHAVALAAGYLAGGPWIATIGAVALIGPSLVASFERLLPDRRAVARVAALLAVASPLLLGLAAGYMSHATLAAAASLGLYAGLRAEEDGVFWAVLAGAAVGAMVTIRPVTGLAIGAVVTAGVWLTSPRAKEGKGVGRRWLLGRFGAWVAGGVPFAIAFGWFNARFFGSPLVLGYTAASGPNHGLGFHEDPWGRMYTLTAAVGHTSSELIAMGRDLLGTPVPLVGVIGLFLLVVPKLSRGERILVAWATLPVLASALYWHHDLVFGPRMLGEAVPAWSALAVLAFVGLTAVIRNAWASEAVAVWAVLLAVFAVAYGGPERFDRFQGRLGVLPEVEEARPSLVFVHEPWGDRLGGQLAGRGLRLDSVRTLLTRYRPCQLEAGLRGVPQSEASPLCQREQASDRLGVLGLTSLLWLGDLPGLPPEGALWVRDLGPERNAALIARYPERVPLFVLPPATQAGEWLVVPYERGVHQVWSPVPGPGDGPGDAGRR